MNADILSSAIDWNQIWKETIRQHKMIYSNYPEGKNSINLRFSNCFSYLIHRWNDTIGFDKGIKNIPIKNNFKILDVGAGPGTHSIPLSKMVKHITAIEPSNGMINCLRERIRENEINNISCVQKRWEDVDLTQDLDCPYDLVLASFSLIMDDIELAIEKMMRASSCYVYLIWHIGMPSWEKLYVHLWKSLFQIPYYPIPKANCLFNVLNQMNIYPNIETFIMDNFYSFKTKNEAYNHFKNELMLTKKNQKYVLKNYLYSTLKKENGHFILDGSSHYAIIWWKKTKQHMSVITG